MFNIFSHKGNANQNTELPAHPSSRKQTTTNADRDAGGQDPYILLVGMKISAIIMESSVEVA
jgi:hypothetical protein